MTQGIASPTIDVTYEITCAAGQNPERVAREIALEQTVELPDGFSLSNEIEASIVGRVVGIDLIEGVRPSDAPDAGYEISSKTSRCRVTIAYNAEVTAWQLPQFLNVLYGNISIKNFIKVTDVNFSAAFLENFTRGPSHGIEGLRRLTGVYGRPLLSTALKPMGLSPGALAEIAAAFAEGGGDIVKDDHGLVDHPFCPFFERVARVQEAVERVNARTGRKTLYFPNILAPAGRIEQQVRYAMSRGVRGILVSPFLIGPDVVRALSENFGIAIMTHPAFTGTLFHDPLHGITPSVLLGTVFRLAGADICVFPNYGGRFGLSREDCRAIDNKLKAPLGPLLPALPAPAGGMTLDRIAEMAALYGPDAVYLIGGALLGHGGDVALNTRVFLDKIRGHFHENIKPPQAVSSSCEMPIDAGGRAPVDAGGCAPVEHLEFFDGFSWLGRLPEIYKSSADEDFKDVARHELIGKTGEKTGFDLRYFQIGPGGFSSLEKHVHVHAIVCIRGAGTITVGEKTYKLKPFDAAYVPPLAVHRLSNNSEEPFGFLCIVDHDRDRPVKP